VTILADLLPVFDGDDRDLTGEDGAITRIFPVEDWIGQQLLS
jgi:hypothetical protein